MKYLYMLILSPVYVVSYIMKFFWDLPKNFCKITVKNYEHRTGK